MYKIILIPLLLFTHLLFLPQAQASDYSIPDIRIEAQIGSDGVITIHEHRTYVYSGSFSWADYRIPRDGFDEIRNIRVSEGDVSYVNDDSEEPGTFIVSASDRSVQIKWHYEAQDTTRTFTISYELEGAMTAGPEWTEFFWIWAAQGRERSTDQIDISIELPETADSDSLHFWIRSPLENFTGEISENRFLFTGQDIPRSQAVQTRQLFPGSLIDTGALQTDSNLTLAAVTAEEEELIREREEREQRAEFYLSFATELAIAISLLSILIFFLIYNRYGRRHRGANLVSRETVLIPGQTPPAIAGMLISNNMISMNHFTATILDLARRGWFTIEEVQTGEDRLFSSKKTDFRIGISDSEPDDDPAEWEKKLIRFLKSEISDGNDTFEKIYSETGWDFNKFWGSWKSEVNKAFDEKNWKDPSSIRGVLYNVVLQIILLVPVIYILVVSGSEAMIFAAMWVGLMAVFSFAIQRRTPEGEEAYTAWKNYRSGLKNAKDHTLQMELLDRHFIYATAFGLSEKEMKRLLEPHDSVFTSYLPWLILMQGSYGSAASISSSFTKLTSYGGSSFGSSVSGGGASMGSAGGGASGGAG